MRGRLTLLLVAALIGLGFVAALDALRGREDTPDRVRAVAATSSAAELRHAGVTGVLYVSVRREGGCSLRALNLPSLQDVTSFELDDCRFDVSRNGTVVSGPPCGRGRYVHVLPGAREPPAPLAGCAPAWRPDGALTFVRDGDVVTPMGMVVQDVARFARRALGKRAPLTVHELAWITNRRLAVLVRGAVAVGNVVILVESGAPVGEPIFVARGTNIYVSRAQELLAGRFGVQAFDRRGRFVSANRFGLQDIRAVAESPGGRWVALARPGNVCIYEEVEPPPRERFPITCLPFDAVDLAWL